MKIESLVQPIQAPGDPVESLARMLGDEQEGRRTARNFRLHDPVFDEAHIALDPENPAEFNLLELSVTRGVKLAPDDLKPSLGPWQQVRPIVGSEPYMARFVMERAELPYRAVILLILNDDPSHGNVTARRVVIQRELRRRAPSSAPSTTRDS